MWDLEGYKKWHCNKPLANVSKIMKVYVFTKLNVRSLYVLYECKKDKKNEHLVAICNLTNTELTILFVLFFGLNYR